MKFIPHVIDGQEAESVSGARFASVDPWLREPYAEVALRGPEDADRAVRAARRAFNEGPWPRMGYAARRELMHRFADLIEANAALFASRSAVRL
jgi:aminomuconate-semialdehyde/2-hydroxymuconate-6-semialdehyde dehydrogenase